MGTHARALSVQVKFYSTEEFRDNLNSMVKKMGTTILKYLTKILGKEVRMDEYAYRMLQLTFEQCDLTQIRDEFEFEDIILEGQD